METVKRRLCCCCYKEEAKVQESTIVITKSEGSVITQPVKSADESLRMTQTNGHSIHKTNEAFVNDTVDLEEIDLNERQLSLRSKGREFNNNRQTTTRQDSQFTTEETVNVTGLMLDQLYDQSDDDECTKHLSQKHDDCLSDHIVEEYILDTNAVTEATEEEIKEISNRSPTNSVHLLTINLGDRSPNKEDAILSEIVIDDPKPVPRSPNRRSIPPSPTSSSSITRSRSNSPPPIVHEIHPTNNELGTDHRLNLDLPLGHASTSHVTAQHQESPIYAAVETSRTSDPFQLELENRAHSTRMYSGFSSESSDSDCESTRTSERDHKQRDYVVLSNEETDKSVCG
ncbi:hypothetical protein M3Y98_00232000 [Aphelenchoides besseyi]|nr:hypothetical protein M3Y98_00232000 [Aphelenchoides besseyi]KAI6200596.1 hypothetical protein M3Y96_00750800 [Aphelenchoides besseyi]